MVSSTKRQRRSARDVKGLTLEVVVLDFVVVVDVLKGS